MYHLVLRNDDADRRLGDAEWAQVCRSAMAATGIAPEGDPAGCRWVAVRHADEHVHLVATLAREDGRVPRIWNDYRALGQVAHTFEDRFGLRSTAGRDDNTAARRPGVKEAVTAERAGRVPPREVLRGKVKAAAGASRDFAEFTARLARDGVTVWPRLSERVPGELTGYAVSLNDWTNGAGQPVRFGGGKLAPDLSLPKLRDRWEPAGTGPAAPADGPTAAAPTAPRGGGPLSGDEAERVWQEAERIVREAADRIRVEAATDPDGAADAAWAAGDTLSAAAAGIEGERGGPLTEAAEAFDRAGRESYRRVPVRTDTGTALRTAARMVARLAPGTSRPGAQVAALTVALAALAAAVAELRAAQQRAHQAEAALAAASRLHGSLPTVVPPSPQRGRQSAPAAAASTPEPAGQRPRSPLARSFPTPAPRPRRDQAGSWQNAEQDQERPGLDRGQSQRGPYR